jgi:energy-coupling factor transport system ATP-binding protein
MEETLEADRIFVMDRGKIVQSAKPEELFNGETDLNQLGLEIPVLPRLIRMLRSEGLDIPANILNLNDLVNILC